MAEISKDQERSETRELYVEKSFRSWDENIKKRTFLCRHSGIFNSCKTAPLENHEGNYIVTLLVNEHQEHVLSSDNAYLLPQFHKLTEPMLADINHFCHQKLLTLNDTCNLLNDLLAKKANNSECVVEYQIDPLIRALKYLFWIELHQVQLYTHYGSIVTHNNTAKTNVYNLPLSFFLVVDNNYNSRPITQAFIEDKTLESEQMNHSFLNYAKELPKYVALEEGEKVNCVTSCLDEIFDLLQIVITNTLAKCLQLWAGNRCFVQLGSSNNDNLHSFSMKWAPILGNNFHSFSNQEIELIHSYLKEKQCYAKIFRLTKTLVNKAIELELDEQLTSLLKNFQNNLTMLIANYQNNIVLEKENVQNNIVKVENPVAKKKKGYLQGAQRIFSSIEVN
ncbi:16707_t:CDS:2, partial [Dentiscutata heterogama]